MEQKQILRSTSKNAYVTFFAYVYVTFYVIFSLLFASKKFTEKKKFVIFFM